MSKLFRARQLDANKSLPVFRAEELPDLSEFTTINRQVPQMPTGMEKEEESEHHLQRAISAQQVYGETKQLVIPTPESQELEDITPIKKLYTDEFKQPKQYIHVQAFSIEEELPDYDLDEADEDWLENFNKKKETLSKTKFEDLMDKLEKGSGCETISYSEAKPLMKESEEIMKPIYDHWVLKRKKLKDPNLGLTPYFKLEKRDGTSTGDPYVAFRRRTEKMQTRKNRKNDEASYEKMLKLRRDLKRACTILDMVKRREESKKDMLNLTVSVFEKRFSAGDFSGQMLQQCMDLLTQRYQPAASNLVMPVSSAYDDKVTPGADTNDRDQMTWRKRMQMVEDPHKKNDMLEKRIKLQHPNQLEQGVVFSDEDETIQVTPPDIDIPSEPEEEDEYPDGRFVFRRRRFAKYLAPRFDAPVPLPYVDPLQGGLGDKRFRFACTSISKPRKLIGFARRRMGRGGRVYMDRAYTRFSDNLDDLDGLLNSSSSSFLPNGFFPFDHVTGWRRPSLPHFRPKSPPPRSSTSVHSSSESLEQSQTTEQDSSTPALSTGEPRPRTYRSFSTQPRSKFSLNGIVGSNFTHSSSYRGENNRTPSNFISNGPNSSQGVVSLVGSTSVTSGKNAYSTAPMKAVYALNFPLNSSTSSQLLSNSLVRGNVPFSPTALHPPQNTVTELKSRNSNNLTINISDTDSRSGPDGALFKHNSIDVAVAASASHNAT